MMTQHTIIDRFREMSHLCPDRNAIVSQNHSITYAELLARAECAAAVLLDGYHIAGEELIGIHGLRSIDSIAAMLAAMLAGGAYVPIPADQPEFRKREIIKEAGIRVVLCNGCRPLAGMDNVHFLEMSSIPLEKREIQFPEIKADGLAYVIYTSGSSGNPKGVMIEHRNVLAMIDAFEKAASRHEPLIGTALVSIGFDVSVWEIFSVLCFGGTLHLIDRPQMVADLAAYFVEQDISSAYLPPLILGDFLRELKKQPKPAALRRLLVGVEPIPQKTLQRYLDAIPSLSVINAYGPTETAICATFYPFKGAKEPDQRTPIGWAADGYQVHIVDDNLRHVEDGKQGEILICGAGVGRGYHADPELTAAKFINDPFTEKPNRCFRTGDYGRRLADGSIEFIGRRDQQIKVDGFRVECGEIESALMNQENIRHALVISDLTPDGKEHILAYYTSMDGKPVDPSEIRKNISRQLPYYMQPHNLMYLQEFPLTANGKIDRRKLPAMVEDEKRENAGPLSDLENSLIDIFRQVLGDTIANPRTSFFEAGGNSLQAARIIIMIEKKLSYTLSFQEFYEHAAVEELAEFLEGQEKHTETRQTEIPASTATGRFPLSYSQERGWFVARSESDNPAAHSSFILGLTGKLNVDDLHACLQEIVARNEIFRIIFKSEGGVPYQEILPEYDFPFYQVDLTAEDDPQLELRNRALDLNLNTFDISRPAAI